MATGRGARKEILNGGELKHPPFLGAPPFSIKHPQDKLGLQHANRHPGDSCVTLYPKLQIGGRRFAFWRVSIYILDCAKLHSGG